jgi:hypothetical protein
MGSQIFQVSSGLVKPCPRCRQETEFVAKSSQCAEDCCEVWIECKCGFDPHALGEKLEDVWGSLDKQTILEAIDCWNAAAIHSKPIYPLLVACFTRAQLDVFCYNNRIPRREVHRIRGLQDLYSRRPDRPILLLPLCHETLEFRTLHAWVRRGGRCIVVSEEQVLTGTFPIESTVLSADGSR